MAGYTDSSYRQLVKEICPQVVCFTEFTSVDAILHGNEATMKQISFNPDRERPLVAQIFGKKPEHFLKAARRLTELGVDAIDINMGCPARKIMSSDHGSALLKNKSLSEEIVRATSEGTHLPVSVKMRIGTNSFKPDHFFPFALSLQDAGASLMTIHGRTSKQMYSGLATWEPIYELKKLAKVPIIGNGDVRSGADAVARLGNLDGVMAGRGSFGNPWMFLEVLAAFHGERYTPPTFSQKIPWMRRHLELSCEFKGEQWGVIEMRKHFAWYVKGLPNASDVRQKFMKAVTRQEVLSVLEEFAEKIGATNE